jgi:hypothetical protein
MMRSFLLKVKSESGVVETVAPSTLNLNCFEALVSCVRLFDVR